MSSPSFGGRGEVFMFDYVIRNAHVPRAVNGGAVDIGFSKGKIAAIEPKLVADAPSYNAEGCLCCGGLVETHIHLDKSRIVDRCTPEPSRSEPNHMKRVQAVKPTFTVGDIYNRAKVTLENCIKQGTTRIRTHAEIDLPVGTKCIEALTLLRKEYAWAVDLEICAFAQEGLTTAPEADKALVAALESGATVIGGAPNYDVDHPGQINRVFELARHYDIDIDMHIDSGHDATSMDTHLVADLTEKHKLGGRVAMGHVTKVAGLPAGKQKDIAKRLADVGVAVTALPATDLFVLARHVDHNVPRCVADLNLFAEFGCNCSISTNNVLNPFTPFGDCSLIRMANLHANVLQVGQPERLTELFEMISSRSARLLNLKDYGIRVGSEAEVTVIDAKSPAEAVATNALVLAVFKRGRQTVSRPRANLIPPP
jgi:cytosine/creatinine deaminase